MRVALETKRATRLRERTENLISLEIFGVQGCSVLCDFPVWNSGIVGEDLPYHIVRKLSEWSGLGFNGCKCCAQYLRSLIKRGCVRGGDFLAMLVTILDWVDFPATILAPTESLSIHKGRKGIE